MKKIIVVVIALVVIASCKKDNATSKVKKENIESAKKRDSQIQGSPIATFDKEVFEFGTVKEGDVVETMFTVTNTGKTDLVIIDATATCGCTVPTWPKEPIASGDSAEIKIEFNTLGKPNMQSKTVTLFTNTERGSEMLKVSGMVIPKDKK